MSALFAGYLSKKEVNANEYVLPDASTNAGMLKTALDLDFSGISTGGPDVWFHCKITLPSLADD